jgi:hypothetical protein
MQWASALDNGNVIPETKRAFMVARSEATFDEGPRWDAIIVARFEHWIFKAWGNLLRWDKNRRTR